MDHYGGASIFLGQAMLFITAYLTAKSGLKTSPGIGGNTRVESGGEGQRGREGGGSKMTKNEKFSE